MRERAELVRGSLEFLTPAGGGTIVRLTVPLQIAEATASATPSDVSAVCMTDKITVLLVDDHALVRRGFRRLLEDDPDIAVVGEGSNGDEAIRLAAELKPR